MATITDLKPQKRNGFINVMVDGEFLCGLTDIQMSNLGLSIGQSVTQERLDELKALSITSKSYFAAIRYLSYRIRSEGEVRDYLKRKDYEAIDSAIERLYAERFLDDVDFCERWVRMRIEQNRSPRAIRSELMQKKVSSAIINEAMMEYGSDTYVDQIRRLIQKKRATNVNMEPEKLMQFLNRKGFAYSDIKVALEDQDDYV
ncbi:MAG: RecX family transcriptional regulator [bacterium]